MRLLRRWKDLTPADRRLLARSLLLLWVLNAVLLVAHYRKVYPRVKRLAALRRGRRQAEPGQAATRVRWAVGVVASYTPWRLSCLCQAMAGLVLASELGLDASLRIGIKRGDLFEGHAWLEADTGVMLGEVDDLNQFVLLALNDEPRISHPAPLSGPDGVADHYDRR